MNFFWLGLVSPGTDFLWRAQLFEPLTVTCVLLTPQRPCVNTAPLSRKGPPCLSPPLSTYPPLYTDVLPSGRNLLSIIAFKVTPGQHLNWESHIWLKNKKIQNQDLWSSLSGWTLISPQQPFHLLSSGAKSWHIWGIKDEGAMPSKLNGGISKWM